MYPKPSNRAVSVDGRTVAHEMHREIVRLNERLHVLEAAARVAIENFARSQASGNFLGDDDYEAWTALEKALTAASGAAPGEGGG